MMILTKAEEAVYRLKKLGISEEMIERMKKSNDVIFISEVFNVQYVGLVPRIIEYKIADLPEQVRKMKDCFFYFGIKQNSIHGTMLCLFFISSDKSEWKSQRDDLNIGNPIVYGYNEDYPDCSEFGSIWFKKVSGGLIRNDLYNQKPVVSVFHIDEDKN